MMRKTLTFVLLTMCAMASAQSFTKFLKHSGGQVLMNGSSNYAALHATTGAQPLTFNQQSDGSYYITINDGGTTKYLTLGTDNAWDTFFLTTPDAKRSRYSIEDVDGKLIRLKNASNSKYLGTDATAAGSHAYSNKDGSNALHHWFLTDKATDQLPIDTFTYYVAPGQWLQENEGWGVSLCWWARMCGEWSDAKLDQLITWLVSPTGLNMRIFRYNIGGGDDPQNQHCTPHHMGSGKGLRAEMEGFQDAPGGPYHWERDYGQRRVMLKIKEKRPDAIFEAFSNSAPWWMTYSGCCSGATDGNKDNLKPEYYEAFAHYLVDVCKHYKDEYGIEFRTLEPFNEAVTNFWYCGGSQEGCHFDAKSQVSFLKVLRPILQASGLSTVISASDETNINTAVYCLKTMQTDGIASSVKQWNTHSYSGNIRDRSQFGSLARSLGARVWMSETGASGQGIAGNLALMQRMFNDIHYLLPSAWIDWQYVEEVGDQWCLVNAQFNNESSAQRVKSYYVRQQATRFIPEGYHFVPSLNTRTLAAVSPDSTKLVLVLLNADAQKSYHRIRMPFTKVDGTIRFYQTTASANVQRLTGRTRMVGDTILQVQLDPLSIATLEVPIQIKHSGDLLTADATYLLVPQSNVEAVIEARGGNVVLGNLATENLSQRWTFAGTTASSSFRMTSGRGDIITSRAGEYPLITRTTTATRQNFLVKPVEDYFWKFLNGVLGFDLQGNGLTDGTTVGMYTYGSSVEADTRNWMLIKFDQPDPTAIDCLPADASTPQGPLRYYAPTGQQTSSLQRGINIVRQGSKATKILVP